ncbi:MAG: N-acetyl-D-glucosamine ABC transporter, permease protein 2, partial [uncultured Rubellimicrobium sp.]
GGAHQSRAVHRGARRADRLYADRPVSRLGHPDQQREVPPRHLRLATGAAHAGKLGPRRLHHGDGEWRLLWLLPELAGRHGSLSGFRAPIRGHGGLRAVRIPVPRQPADGPLPRPGDHDPDPPRHRGDPPNDGGRRSREHSDRTHPGLHRAGPAARGLHPVGVHAQRLGRPQERGPHGRTVGIRDLLQVGAAARPSRHGDRRRLHDDPDLERPLVSPDPCPFGGDKDDHLGVAGLHRPVRHELERGPGGAEPRHRPRPRPLPHLLAAADPRDHRRSREM